MEGKTGMKPRGQEIIDLIERAFGPVMIVKWGNREYKVPDPPTPKPLPAPRVIPPTIRDKGLF